MTSHLALVLALTAMCAVGVSSTAECRSWEDRRDRAQFASAYHDSLAQVLSQIPTLSPAEEAWLSKEIDEDIARAGNTYTKRALAAMDSREYQIRVARPRLQRLLSVLGTLSAKGTTPHEATLWTQVASAFIDRDLWQAMDALVRAGVIAKNVDGVNTYYFENHVLWAKEILDGFVLPSLRKLHD